MIRTRVGIADGYVGERNDEIRRMLVERRRELLNEIQTRVRDVREEGSSNSHRSIEPGETLEAEGGDDLAFALIQMKAEILEKINDALRHLNEGTYGYCVECGEVIATSRLRAMPFAVRCKDCEEMREYKQQRHRVQSQRVMSELDSRY